VCGPLAQDPCTAESVLAAFLAVGEDSQLVSSPSVCCFVAVVCFALGYFCVPQPDQRRTDFANPPCSSRAADSSKATPPEATAVATQLPEPSAQQPPPPSLSSINHLLTTHRAAIEKLRSLVRTHPHFKPERHDGLWLLRYLLSNKLSVHAAARAVCKSLKLRHERGLDEIADIVRTKPVSGWPHFEEVRALATIEMFGARAVDETVSEAAAWKEAVRMLYIERAPSVQAVEVAQAAYAAHGGVGQWHWHDNGLVEIGRLRDLHMHELWPMRAKLDVVDMYSCEWLFQHLDDASRRKGELVKATQILSLDGFSLRMLNLKLVRWDANRKAESQDLYPQQQDKMLFVNSPKALLWAWTRVVRPLLPKRVAEKTQLIDTSRPAGLKALEKCCRLEGLPVFLGGSSSIPWPPDPNVLFPPLGPLTFGKDGTFVRYD
jgi:hypothetical protein